MIIVLVVAAADHVTALDFQTPERFGAVIPGRELCAKLTSSILSRSERTRNPDQSLDSGFVAIGPRFARTRCRRPGMTAEDFQRRTC
jgi:hypothetical protein